MTKPQSRVLRVASTLFWVWGVLLILSGIAVGYPMLAIGGGFGVLVAMVSWGIAHCMGGYALRRRKWGVRWWASALCISSALLPLAIRVMATEIGAVLNMLALVLILISWGSFASAPTKLPTESA